MSDPTCLEWALRYAAKGRLVFPAHAWLEGKCSCGEECSSPAKHPLTPHGLKDATTDERQLRTWWKKWPHANVAVATGEASGLVILDVDPRHGGEDSMVALREDVGNLPRTFIARTGGGGSHFYFRHPGGGLRVPNSAGKLGPGLDIRGDGGYVLAPPSNHQSGGTYAWAEAAEEMAIFPESLLALLRGPARAEPDSRPASPAAAPRLAGDVSAYGRKALEAEVAELRAAGEGRRNVALNRAAFSLGQLVAGGELPEGDVEASLLAAAADIGLTEAEAKRTLRSGLAGGMRNPRCAPPREERPAPARPPAAAPAPAPAAVATEPPAEAPAPTRKEKRPAKYTDLGNCWRFADRHGEDLRHTRAHGWLVWDGKRWRPEERNEVLERAKETVAVLLRELVRDDMSDDQKKAALGWALKSQGRSRIEAMLGLAISEPAVAAAAGDFDADEWLLNCRNGTLELRTGQLRPHRKADCITKILAADFDPAARAPRWEAYLARVLPDAEVREFVQRLVGYALTGSTREQIVAILHGMGNNGKSVFVETVRDLLGDYAKTTPFDTFLVRKGTGPRDDIAALVGARLVTASEPEQNARLAESVVKQLTGGDTVSARRLYRDLFEFRPCFKVFLSTNHKPRILGTDEGIWRRVRLVPFTVTIPEAERDQDLPRRLRSEFPGILRWAVEGCLWWQKEGLRAPAAVLAATRQYREEEDLLAAFLDDCTEADEKAETEASSLRRRYEAWCRDEDCAPVNANLFSRMLTERGFESAKQRGTGARVKLGIRLRLDWFPKHPGAPAADRQEGRRDRDDDDLWRRS